MNEYILDYLFENPSETFWLEHPEATVGAKVVSALANCSGGSLVVGAGETGVIVGITEQETQTVIKEIGGNIKPFPPFTTAIVERDEKKVLIINVWAGNNKPYICYDAYYVRAADRIRKASLDEITSVTSNQEETNYGWERRYTPGVELSDLNSHVLEKTRKELTDSGRIAIGTSDATMLKSIGLMSMGHITNAGVVLFANTPSSFLPQTRIRVSVYGGDDDMRLLDVRLFDANLISGVDDIVGYILSLYRQTLSVEGLLRKEKQILPLVALREGVLNAVVHRIYEDYDSYVAINIYGNRLEIVNSGELYGNLKVEDLAKTHKSVLRNPDIANTLFALKYIEMAGSGTLRIIEECRKNGNPLPQWKSEQGLVTLIFSGVQHNDIALGEDFKFDTSKLTSELIVQKTLEQILNYMRMHEKVKLPEIVELTGKSYASAKRYMRILKDAGLVGYEGNLRTGGWQIVQDIEQ